MTRSEALEKLISVRHYCFVRGVLGNRKKGHDEHAEDDFRQAFRTVNRLYVELRDNIAPRSTYTRARRSERRSRAA
jgi:hypothetical protein